MQNCGVSFVHATDNDAAKEDTLNEHNYANNHFN